MFSDAAGCLTLLVCPAQISLIISAIDPQTNSRTEKTD